MEVVFKILFAWKCMVFGSMIEVAFLKYFSLGNALK
jgi:hypothetical protein